MTLADSKALASAIDPKVRDYIDAKIKEELSPIRDDLYRLRIALLEVQEADVARGDTISAQVVKIQSIIKLSRSRVEQIAEKLGDE
jgi:hypothetical protein